jgi:LysR family transcriptional regulator, transcriptional activator of nhaA
VTRVGTQDIRLLRGLRFLGSSEGVKDEIHGIWSSRGVHHPLVQRMIASATASGGA